MIKKPKLISSIRAKLVSAVAMLLVAVIMVVSSTYAWFTLSTAPEVTGISTQIGANGALEMALHAGAFGTEPLNGQVDESKDVNTYWGNLVDLIDAKYGLNNIVLYPSMLNADDTVINSGSLLKTPVYGEDGRIEKFDENTMIGTFDSENQNFAPNANYGVRGVGTSSGMSPRQLAYRNGAANALASMTKAKTLASTSLNQNGPKLASLAVKLSMDKGTTTYTAEEIAILKTSVENLRDGALNEINSAYKYILQAYAASAAVTDAELWNTVKSAVDNGSALATVQALVTGLPTEITNAIAALTTTNGKVAQALTDYETLIAGEITAEGIKTVLKNIVNPSDMTLNNFPVSDLTNDPTAFVNDYMGNPSQGINVYTKTGGGVYADVADHCGEYSAAIVIDEITYGTMHVTNVAATMHASTTVSPLHILGAGTSVDEAGAPAAEEGAATAMTEFYGYVIDLYFRTNALDSDGSNSDLLLQTDAVDRIYKDNAEDALTQGSGSNMEFTATTQDMTAEQIQALMKAIRIVFFTPEQAEGGATTNTILGYARLDVDGILEEDADAITNVGGVAPIKMWDDETGDFKDTNVITELAQNTAVKVSVLVYLDGESVTNATVAASAATSVTGSMNLQFASSANLIPMENGDLHLD